MEELLGITRKAVNKHTIWPKIGEHNQEKDEKQRGMTFPSGPPYNQQQLSPSHLAKLALLQYFYHFKD